MLAYLCVLNNPADDLRLTRIINNPPRGIGAKTVECRPDPGRPGRASSLWEVLRRRGGATPSSRKLRPSCRQFTDMMERAAAPARES